MKREKRIVYVEPENYFPEEILKECKLGKNAREEELDDDEVAEDGEKPAEDDN